MPNKPTDLLQKPMDITFSIIIPSYNQGIYVRQTIDSILNQSYKNVEVLVIDGGSTDNTIEILKRYGNRIFWISEKDRGQTHAINKGLALAKGNIIAYLNSDDYYLDNTLQLIVDAFTTHENALWVTGDYVIVDEAGKKVQNAIGKYKYFFRNMLSFNLLLVLNPIIQPSTFLSRTLVDKIGLFNESLHYVMDYEYWLKAMKIQQPIIVRNSLSAFRIHKKSKGGSQYRKQFEEELAIARVFHKNQFLLFLHLLHNKIIYFVYSIIK